MLREYQQRAIDQLYDWFNSNESGNPCLVLPTGSGKSHIIAALVKDALTSWPETSVLMLTHQKELISQNAEKMREHWRNAPMGIYSASLKRRVLSEPITFAGIQSVRKKGKLIGHVDLVIVDECHSINHDQVGGYRTLLSELLSINPALRIIGLSATPYRLGHGYIHEGHDVIFDDLIEPVSIEELVNAGYLSTLRSKHTSLTLEADGVKKQGGDYVASELEKIVDTDDNNRTAVDETIKRAHDRKSWLFFCAGVHHAQNVAAILRENGINAACLTGDTAPSVRDQLLTDFKAGRIRALTNVNVLTTGFDYPGIDCIVMLRPTLSPGLYMQMAGRGMRIADGKDNCLVLDFAGNVSKHGPITHVQPPSKKRKGEGSAPTKKCEACQEIVAANCKICPECGFVFEVAPKVETPVHLYNDDIMGYEPLEMKLTSWRWSRYVSRTSGKEMLKLAYYGGISDPIVVEYLPVMHEGYAGEKALRLLRSFTIHGDVYGFSSVVDVDACAESMNELAAMPVSIQYLREGKFFKVVGRSW